MNITRQTKRADGLTVGEAMDRDADALRQIGIPGDYGAPTLDERRDYWQRRVRHAVLDALDSIAPMRERGSLGPDNDGWRDCDLPALFKALDQHADTLFERHGMAAGNFTFTDPRNAGKHF